MTTKSADQFEAAAKLYHQAIADMRQNNANDLDPSLITAADNIMRDIKRSIFPFFDLPVELRDLIYDFSLVDIDAVATKDDAKSADHNYSHRHQADRTPVPERTADVRMAVHQTTSSNLLSVSRQFNHEYRARLPLQKTVILCKVAGDLICDLRSLEITPPLRGANHLVLHHPIDLPRSAARQDFSQNLKTLPMFLARLPSIQTMTIYWIFTPAETAQKLHKAFNWEDTFLLLNDFLVKSRVVTPLTVYACAGKVAHEMLKWSSDTDEVEHLATSDGD